MLLTCDQTPNHHEGEVYLQELSNTQTSKKVL